MFQIRGLGATDTGYQGGQGEQYDETGEWQTGSGGGGSGGSSLPLPKTVGTRWVAPSSAYTSPPPYNPPIIFPPPSDMPPPLPLPTGQQDVPTAGTNVVPVLPNQPPPGYVAVGTRTFPMWWLAAGAAVGVVGGIVLFLARR